MFKVLSQHLRDILTMTFERDLEVDDLRKWMNIRANSFLDEPHKTKMGEGAWKTLRCTNI